MYWIYSFGNPIYWSLVEMMLFLMSSNSLSAAVAATFDMKGKRKCSFGSLHYARCARLHVECRREEHSRFPHREIRSKEVYIIKF